MDFAHCVCHQLTTVFLCVQRG